MTLLQALGNKQCVNMPYLLSIFNNYPLIIESAIEREKKVWALTQGLILTLFGCVLGVIPLTLYVSGQLNTFTGIRLFACGFLAVCSGILLPDGLLKCWNTRKLPKYDHDKLFIKYYEELWARLGEPPLYNADMLSQAIETKLSAIVIQAFEAREKDGLAIYHQIIQENFVPLYTLCWSFNANKKWEHYFESAEAQMKDSAEQKAAAERARAQAPGVE